MLDDVATGGPTFPVAPAQALIDMLEQIANDLDDAATQRATAADDMPDYQGVYANQYHDATATYTSKTSDTTDLFRRTAGSLRDAIEEHGLARQQWMDIGQPV